MNRSLAVLGLLPFLPGMLPQTSPQEPNILKPVNLAINTAADEADPHVSSNHLTLFYAAHTGQRWELRSSTRMMGNDPWPPGTPLPDIKSKDSDFRSPFLTTDGKYPQRFYYSSNMDPLTRGEKGDNYDLYYHVKFDAKGGFGSYNAVVTVGTEQDELHPWLTPDELQLYFSRKTDEGWRLFVSRRPKDGGQFGPPEQVKLPPGFHHPTLTPDGKTMYLQGPVGPRGRGQRWGLFVTTSTDGKTWSPPEPLVHLNSTQAVKGDLAPSLSRDGKLLYFASDRPGGKGGLDIYVLPTADLKNK